jgi:stage V sporulation protein AC
MKTRAVFCPLYEEVYIMNMTEKEYTEYAQSKTPKSKLVTNCIKAFLIGGAICTIGQGFLNLYKYLGMSEEDASTLVTITMIFLGTFSTGLNIYPKIAKHGGAGTLVPVTGFANAVAAPALEAKTEGYVLGVGAKIFTIAGPVILYGTLASIVCGILYFLWNLI